MALCSWAATRRGRGVLGGDRFCGRGRGRGLSSAESGSVAVAVSGTRAMDPCWAITPRSLLCVCGRDEARLWCPCQRSACRHSRGFVIQAATRRGCCVLCLWRWPWLHGRGFAATAGTRRGRGVLGGDRSALWFPCLARRTWGTSSRPQRDAVQRLPRHADRWHSLSLDAPPSCNLADGRLLTDFTVPCA